MARRRRILLKPFEAMQYDYIYFDGNHFVNTGYKPTNDSIIEIGFTAYEGTNDNPILFGSRYSSGSLTTFVCSLNAIKGNLVSNFSDTPSIDITDYSVVGTEIDMSYSGTETMVETIVAQHIVDDLSVNANGHTNHNIYLGALNQNDSVLDGTGFKGNISYFRIYEGSDLEYSLVVQNGRFYDEVDGIYYDLQQISDTPIQNDYVIMYNTTDDSTPIAVYFDDTSEMYSWCFDFADKADIKDLKAVNMNNTLDNMTYMFSAFSSMETINLRAFRTIGNTNMYAMFAQNPSLQAIDFSTLDTKLVETIDGMCQNGQSLASLDLSMLDFSAMEDIAYAFKDCINLETLNLTDLDLSSVDMTSKTFENCAKLSTAITITNPNVSEYEDMFNGTATEDGAEVIVNYTDDTYDLAVAMVATKSDNSNVVLYGDTPTESYTYLESVSSHANDDDILDATLNAYTFIDYTPEPDDEIYVKLSSATTSVINGLFGCRTSADSSGYAALFSTRPYTAHGGATAQGSVYNLTANTVYEYTSDNTGQYFDGVFARESGTDPSSATAKFAIGGLGNSVGSAVDGRHYGQTHYEMYAKRDGEYHVHIKPAIKNSTGEVGFHDIINDVFYGSVNDVAWTAGDVIAEDTYLQWLELNDGGYFAPEFYPNEATSYVDAKFSVDLDQPYKGTYNMNGLFGTRNSNSCIWNCFISEVTSSSASMRPDFLSGTTSGASVAILSSREEFISLRSEIVNSSEYNLYVDDELLLTTTNSGTDISLQQARIFNFSNNSTGELMWGSTCGKIAEWTYGDYVDGVAVPSFNLVPVIRGIDGVVCLKNELDGTYVEVVDGVAIAGSVIGALPYIEVEYLESTGTQYINTGYVVDNLTGKTTLAFEFTDGVADTKGVYGHRIGSSDRNELFTYNSSIYYCGNSANVIGSMSDSVKYNVTVDRDNATATVNDVDFSMNINATTTPNQPQYLFSNNSNSPMIGKIYTGYTEQDIDGNVVLEMKTVQLTQDVSANTEVSGSTNGVTGEYGMWNVTHDCFHGNIGTGTFSGGPEQTEYLQSLYDLGVTPASTEAKQQQQLIDLGVTV